MRGKTAFIGFLVIEIIIVALWVASLSPVLGSGAPFISPDAHVFSGALWASEASDFRLGVSGALSYRPFRYDEYLLWAALLIGASGVSAWFAGWAFRKNWSWVAVGLGILTLGLAIGGGYYIVEQFGGDTMYPPGSVNEQVLYMATRAFLMQAFIGWVLIAGYTVLTIAGFATAGKPLGYHLAIVNWLITAGTWLVMFIGLFLVPSLTTAAAPA
ncbi:MAG TPA: hypothetical protein VG942_07190 [Hyphomonadaceae bacterium]|nr:hypothetical protein [Hyphomonadaceae bacterium]